MGARKGRGRALGLTKQVNKQIGAALVGADGTVLGRGHNMRTQLGNPILHVRNTILPGAYTRLFF